MIVTATTGGVRLAPADIAFGEWYYYQPLPTVSPSGAGTFTSSDISLAKVVANVYPGTGATTTGYVKGIAGGVPVISFTDNYSGCIVSKTVTVNPLPVIPAITGLSSVCAGATITLSNTDTGGIWSSTIPTIATVNAITGQVTGASFGVDTIKYYVTNSCGTSFVKTLITVSGSIPAVPGTVTGLSGVCLGTTITMHDTTAGGTWSSSTLSIATIDPLSGVVNPVVPGSTVIIYTVSNSCGSNYNTMTITVDPVPSAITGPDNVCLGASVTLHDSVAGGTWSSSAGFTAAAVPTTGVVSGLATGAATITYTVGTALCRTTTVVTVNPLPAIFCSVWGRQLLCGRHGGTYHAEQLCNRRKLPALSLWFAVWLSPAASISRALDFGLETTGSIHHKGC